MRTYRAPEDGVRCLETILLTVCSRSTGRVEARSDFNDLADNCLRELIHADMYGERRIRAWALNFAGTEIDYDEFSMNPERIRPILNPPPRRTRRPEDRGRRVAEAEAEEAGPLAFRILVEPPHAIAIAALAEQMVGAKEVIHERIIKLTAQHTTVERTISALENKVGQRVCLTCTSSRTFIESKILIVDLYTQWDDMCRGVSTDYDSTRHPLQLPTMTTGVEKMETTVVNTSASTTSKSLHSDNPHTRRACTTRSEGGLPLMDACTTPTARDSHPVYGCECIDGCSSATLLQVAGVHTHIHGRRLLYPGTHRVSAHLVCQPTAERPPRAVAVSTLAEYASVVLDVLRRNAVLTVQCAYDDGTRMIQLKVCDPWREKGENRADRDRRRLMGRSKLIRISEERRDHARFQEGGERTQMVWYFLTQTMSVAEAITWYRKTGSLGSMVTQASGHREFYLQKPSPGEIRPTPHVYSVGNSALVQSESGGRIVDQRSINMRVQSFRQHTHRLALSTDWNAVGGYVVSDGVHGLLTYLYAGGEHTWVVRMVHTHLCAVACYTVVAECVKRAARFMSAVEGTGV
ncbi:hypothetical protein DFP72DRAFT_855294 [Ephemerocybe angulata]|uniref:Uncharacterized protein n=1 Tax=Ephemerocybe angulata TaxID=980116 RepID=A0A8H6HHQ5_9AGAR|nr:hypothetical protein DFP72DRAFT_855294 [Tulosesus angulatus]